MQNDAQRLAIWSVDWEDVNERFHPAGRFVESSRRMHEILGEVTGGRMTWYAKVDFLSDITDHPGLDRLGQDILDAGGEIGPHIHHCSWAPYWRKRAFQRAHRVLQDRLGVVATSYSSGMGNYVNTDTRTLLELGFRDGRLLYPWLKHDFAAHFDHPYYSGLAGMDLLDSAEGIRAGYVDPEDYRRYAEEQTVANFPQTRLPEYRENPDSQYQLTLGVNTEENSEWLITSAEAHSRFIHGYCHPSDVCDEEGCVTKQAVKRIKHLAALLKAKGFAFVTSAQARAAFERYGEIGA